MQVFKADNRDLSDIDHDGQLDFEEFCITMRLIYDTLNGVYPTVPSVLPPSLIPASKSHLVTASAALSRGSNLSNNTPKQFPTRNDSGDDDFDWYQNKEDKANYEKIYSSHADRNGMIRCEYADEM